MIEYYRVKVGERQSHIIDDTGALIEPGEASRIINRLKSTLEKPTYIYVGTNDTGLWKIGITKDIIRRADQLEIDMPLTWKAYSWGEKSARNVEKALHEIFTLTGQHETGEWFRLLPIDVLFLKHLSSYKFSYTGMEQNPDIFECRNILRAIAEQGSILSFDQYAIYQDVVDTILRIPVEKLVYAIDIKLPEKDQSLINRGVKLAIANARSSYVSHTIPKIVMCMYCSNMHMKKGDVEQSEIFMREYQRLVIFQMTI